MRKKIFVLVVCIVMAGQVEIQASADGMILPETFFSDYLGVRYHHVTVNIEDNIAVTRVEQEFYNPFDTSISGQYVFPIPPDGILSDFRVVVDGQDQVVTHQDQVTTNTLLFDMVNDRQDPSLLQYMDWESFTFDVSLPPGGSRQMTLEYQEIISPVGGMYHYKYILSTERYAYQPLESASIQVTLKSSAGLSTIYSSSHGVEIKDQGEGQALISWEASYIQPQDDFDLYYAPSDNGFGSGFLTGEREGFDHFLFMFAPDINSIAVNRIPKDIVFIIDRSGSMSGEKLIQAKEALRYILGRLDEEDRFSVIGYNHLVTPLFSKLRTVSEESLENALSFVDRFFADGSTDIYLALQTGLDIFERSDHHPGTTKMIVFLTDGLPTEGITDDASITRLVTNSNQEVEARIHVFGVGYDVNTHLLDSLAGENGGSVTYVQPGENLESVMVNFYERISTPVLTDIEIEFQGMTVNNLHPQMIPDLFQGSSLMLTGRFQAVGRYINVRVRGKVGEQHRVFVYNFNLNQSNGHDFVPRLWATRQIGMLLDEIRVEGETDQMIDEIRELGLHYGVVTPYTSYIITPQTSGAASTANMALYDDMISMNTAFGSTTIQGRVQNMAYQNTDQASLAVGANVMNSGQNSIAQISNQNVDLSVISDLPVQDGPLTVGWLADNIEVDRNVVFGSEEYFDLAQDPEVRTFLQTGANVIFEQDGEVIAVQTQDVLDSQESGSESNSVFERIIEFFESLFSW